MLLQMTGLFRPQDLTSEWRVDVRKSFAEAINIILAEDERCCSYPTDIAITSTCYPDYTGCISLVLRSRPQDCGDGDSFSFLCSSICASVRHC